MVKKIVLLSIILIVSCAKPTKKDVVLAIQSDNLKKFQSLREKINIDTLQFDLQGTALHFAIQSNANAISNQLIEEEFLINEKDSLGYTALLALIQDSNPNTELIDKLLAKNAEVNVIEDYNGYSALHYAIYNNQLELVKKLLRKNANANIQTTSIMKSTPMHLAIEKGHTEIAHTLFEHASDTIKNVNDKTVVDLAIKSKDNYFKQLYYAKMSTEDKKKLFENVSRKSINTTFLDTLLKENWVSKKVLGDALVFAEDTIVVQQLLNKGASIHHSHSKYKYSAIHYAAVRGNVPMLQFLIKKGANINQLSKDRSMSVLMHAAQLYENFNSINKKGAPLGIGLTQSALDFFANSKDKTKENSLKTVKFLISKNANVNFKDRFDSNVLYYAEASNNIYVANYLKEIGVKETRKFTESKTSKYGRLFNK